MIPEVLENTLGFNVYRVALLFRRELIRSLAEYNMTPEQWQVMTTLWSTGQPLNQSEIVRLILKDKPTISRMIQRLERNGWIEKSASAEDGRVTFIQPSEKGWAIEEAVTKKLDLHFKEILQSLGGPESRVLTDKLRHVRRILGDY
ncbi:MAG: MarR family transcriptional regulator [SAR324 cluster bacterium]|uniref:MarR family transcriptional regulator n=1 Tax=SAR324 cluster bacterium TaxID=2024889 RepID=A0A2A4T4Z0_9DELT|nr:MAG: MarR family transcriptional regulator [SAR324 cluster bacterium]